MGRSKTAQGKEARLLRLNPLRCRQYILSVRLRAPPIRLGTPPVRLRAHRPWRITTPPQCRPRSRGEAAAMSLQEETLSLTHRKSVLMPAK